MPRAMKFATSARPVVKAVAKVAVSVAIAVAKADVSVAIVVVNAAKVKQRPVMPSPLNPR